MDTPDIHCSECGDAVSINVARVDDNGDSAMDPEDIRYLCPVCAIQLKNVRMQALMVQQLSGKS